MSDYKHEWVNDWAKYFVVDKIGQGIEFSHKLRSGLGHMMVDYMREYAYVDHAYKGMFEDSLTQRYTDQQMELEALNEGWAALEKQKLCEHSTYDFYFRNGSVEVDEKAEGWELGEDGEFTIIAYRLSNAEGYKDGERVVLRAGDYLRRCSSLEHKVKRAFELANLEYSISSTHIRASGYTEGKGRLLTPEQVINAENGVKVEPDKPNPVLDFAEKILHGEPKHREWLTSAAKAYVEGEELPEVDTKVSKEWVNGLPPVGTDCDIEFCNHTVYKATITYQGDGVGAYIHSENGKEFTMSHRGTNFRPIRTHKQRVIEKAMRSAGYNQIMTEEAAAEYLGILYDLGALSMPNDKEGE